MKIAKRDIKFILTGVLVFLLISFFWDYNNNIKSFKDGYNDAKNIASDE